MAQAQAHLSNVLYSEIRVKGLGLHVQDSFTVFRALG